MRLANVATPYGPRIGAMDGNAIIDLQAAECVRQHIDVGLKFEDAWLKAREAIPWDMRAFLSKEAAGFNAAEEALEFARSNGDTWMPRWAATEAEYLPVVNMPPKLYVLRGNYKKHRQEMGLESPESSESRERPRFIGKARTSVVGHGGNIPYPSISTNVQHELELAVVIGRHGRRIVAERAWEHIAGYTIMLDMTARDLSGIDDRNKSFDGFGPVGPVLATRKEIPNPYDLNMSLHVNGTLRQTGNTGQMESGIAEIISFMSEAFTLEPGDIIATGTPEGVGPVEVGDRIEGAIDGIGVLRCDVSAQG